MKKILILLAVSLLVCGCQDWKQMEGGLSFCCIYIVDGDEIVDAQNYTMHFPKEGGIVPLKVIVPSDDLYVSVDKKVDWVSLDAEMPPEINDDKFQDGTWYSQEFVFKVLPNDSRKRRKCSVRIKSLIFNGYAADFTITQAGK